MDATVARLLKCVWRVSSTSKGWDKMSVYDRWKRKQEETIVVETCVKCGCFVLVVLFNIIVGTVATNYLIATFLHTVIPVFWAAVIGLVGAEVIVPAAIIVWILRMLGVLG